MGEALALAGNASSIHAEGRAARATIETARDAVAALMGVKPASVTFVSGGTEAANTLLRPEALGARRLLVGAGEHTCVLQGHGFEDGMVERVALDRNGALDLADLETKANADLGLRTVLALQAVNNETGVIQPVAAAAAIMRRCGGGVVCDAVQAAGRFPLADLARQVHALYISAHKIGGPKGIGAFAVVSDEYPVAAALVRGGGQERGRRAGTENVAAIAGFGAAARIAAEEAETSPRAIRGLRRELETAIRGAAPDAMIFGEGAERTANTVSFSVPGAPASILLIALDLGGCAASSGSACSSGKVTRSHVLAAMGISDNAAAGAIRLSLGWNSRPRDVEIFAQALTQALSRLRGRRSLVP